MLNTSYRCRYNLHLAFHHCHRILCPSAIINQSFQTGCFHDESKKALASPLFKSGSRLNVINLDHLVIIICHHRQLNSVKSVAVVISISQLSPGYHHIWFFIVSTVHIEVRTHTECTCAPSSSVRQYRLQCVHLWWVSSWLLLDRFENLKKVCQRQ